MLSENEGNAVNAVAFSAEMLIGGPEAASVAGAAVEPAWDDLQFHQKRKHGKWRGVEPPRLEAPVADTHAHIHMLPNPGLALHRAAALGVQLVLCVTDPSEDGLVLFEGLEGWCAEARERGAAPEAHIIAGVHPHNARLWDARLEAQMRSLWTDPRVCAIGEIGLDYHYDFSPRELQRAVFARQLELAAELQLPVSLHVREAHDEAFAIVREVGVPPAGLLLHCFNMPADELERWASLGCYFALGGPLTFKNTAYLREAVAAAPLACLLTETDAPYMTPEPLRGARCEPAHTLLTAARLAEVRGVPAGESRAALLHALYGNARRFFRLS